MAVRYDDVERTLALSVRDLVEEGAPAGHLSLEVVQSRTARAAAGRAVHLQWQLERQGQQEGYQPEVTLKRQVAVGAWTCQLWGRVDGLHQEDGRSVVEEVKSTALDARRLHATTASDWPAWLGQLEIYLWMLAEAGHAEPIGRLVLVSLADGSRHVIGVALDRARVGQVILGRLAELVVARERRIAWMASRRSRPIPLPHAAWRPGQREIAEAVEWGLDAGHPVLVQAPTGLGKTAAAMVGVLRHALRTDKQVFWATARTTQQAGVIKTLGRLAEAGLPLRSVAIAAKEKACLNDRVACRPDACRHAEDYYDKLRAAGLPQGLADLDRHVDTATLLDLGSRLTACPFELGLDLTGEVDLVVGDYNYVLDPSVHLRRHFGEASPGWVVVVDEIHQLVDRARDWYSPRVEASLAREAASRLWLAGSAWRPFVSLAQRIEAAVLRAASGTLAAPASDGLAPAMLDEGLFRELAAEVDAVGLDYALLKADQPAAWGTDDDPWLRLARQVLRMASALEERGPETVAVAGVAEGAERVQLLCLDPSPHLGPRLARLGGVVGLSATLEPPSFYRDLLGLDPERLDLVTVDSPFPKENLRVVVAPRVSTAFKDRERMAGPTAALIERLVASVPGNVAVYFSSFQVLDDLVGRLELPGRERLVQRPGMDDALRREALTRLTEPGRKVLCAVLGGVFAEGIDLPPGALDAVIVVGPALPPVGLERTLLQEHYEGRYGAGFLYASLVPGLTRVVQAAGRLIRRPEDRGVVVLVDRRFRFRDVAALLPRAWDPVIPDDPVAEVAAFFATPD